MCGLVGVMSKTMSENAKKAFYDMLHLDVLRGEDSTGVAVVSNMGTDKMDVELFKAVGPPSVLFNKHAGTKRNRSFTTKPVNIFIGHNRFATQGLVNEENAHPFDFGNVVGAHNGTVSQYSMKDFHGYKDLHVDSQIIYSHLSHTRNINQVWEHADGAMALSYFDKVDQTMHLVRNKERSLHFVYSKDDKTLLWASESWMLYVAAGRQGIELNDIVEVVPDTFYSFNFDEEGKVHHTSVNLPPFVPKPATNYYRGYSQGGYSGNYYDDWEEYTTKKKDDHPKQKEYKNCALIVTEFHDSPRNPLAFGYLQDGTFVKINISPAEYNKAKTRIETKGEQWFFIVPKVYKTFLGGLSNPATHWCQWSDCRVSKLKPHMKIVRIDSTKGFVFRTAHEKLIEKATHAPWYQENLFLTQNKYNSIVGCGCLSCKSIPKWEEANSLRWIDEETFVCKNCQELPLVKEALK